MMDSRRNDAGDGDALDPGGDDLQGDTPAWTPPLLEVLREALRPAPGAEAPGPSDDDLLHADLASEDDLLADLLADDRLRAHVVDVRVAASDDGARLSASVRRAALEAFRRESALQQEHLHVLGDGVESNGVESRGVERNGVSLEPLRTVAARAAGDKRVREQPIVARGWRRRRSRRGWMAAAAVLVAAIGGVLHFGAGDRAAEAGLQLNALARVDRASAVHMSSIEPGFFAQVGHRFSPGADELLSFGFSRDAMLVVAGGDAVRVARSDLLARIRAELGAGSSEAASRDAILRLESGEARLATREGPVLVELGSAGILVLTEGAAHAAFDAGDGSGSPAVALVERSSARFYRPDGSSIPLAGPCRVVLKQDGPHAFGTPARTLFADLEFFGGPLPEPTRVRTVSNRLWRVAEGPARRYGRSQLHILRGTGEVQRPVRLSWRPEPAVGSAQELHVALRAPAGTRVALRGLGPDGADLAGLVEAAKAGTPASGATPAEEPGVSLVRIPLPAGWYDRLADGVLDLVIDLSPVGGAPADRATVRAWFDGVSLIFRPRDVASAVGGA